MPSCPSSIWLFHLPGNYFGKHTTLSFRRRRWLEMLPRMFWQSSLGKAFFGFGSCSGWKGRRVRLPQVTLLVTHGSLIS